MEREMGESPIPVLVRIATHGDIALLERFMPTSSVPEVHRQRFAVQAEGKAQYFIAFHEGVPVGYVLLRFAPPVGEAALTYPDSAYVEGLDVRETWQRQGVATRLMEQLEATSRERLCPTIGLYVGVGNGAAKALYRSLGYNPSGLPPYRVTWPVQNEAGELGEDGETCDFWLKRLE
jgi:ribosomal protein S18 acetylase RimI-like enzyme